MRLAQQFTCGYDAVSHGVWWNAAKLGIAHLHKTKALIAPNWYAGIAQKTRNQQVLSLDKLNAARHRHSFDEPISDELALGERRKARNTKRAL